MRHLCAGLLFVTLTACGKGGGDASWSSRPIETVSATVGDVAFTIDLPKGMHQLASKDEVTFDVRADGRVHTPEVRISVASAPSTVDDDLRFEKDPVVLRKETLPDGWVVSLENSAYKGKEDYLVHAQKKVGAAVLSCNARVTPWSRGEKVKDLVPKVEQMCLSLKAK